MQKRTDLKKISVVAVLCAVAYLCMFLFRFKVQFLTLDFKDAIIAVVAFLYGPIYAVVSSFTVAFLELITVSETGLYGFLMNFISSAAFSASCGLIYKYKRTLSGALLGTVSGVILMTSLMLVANIFITPFYMKVPRQVVIGLIPSLLLPFNLIKGAFNAAITMIIYKPVIGTFKKIGLIPKKTNGAKKGRFLIIALLSFLVIAAAVFVLLVSLKGEFTVFGKQLF